MKTAIFQPTYLPWLGYFKAIRWSDCFVFLDDVQFEKSSWQNRNRIKSSQGDLMLTVPVVRNFPQLIKNVEINYAQNWVKKHLQSIQNNYQKAEFFEEFFPVLEEVYKQAPEKIMDLNVTITKKICEWLEIDANFRFSSEFGVEDLQKNEKLVTMLEKIGTDEYIYAQGAKEYMKEAWGEYGSKGIKLTPLSFEHPVYSQLYNDFVSHLSIIDVIFNCGRVGTKEMLENIKLLSN